MPIECEFKWKAETADDFTCMLTAVKENFKGVVTGPVNILNQDFYLDTPQRIWGAHKTALRVRCANGNFEATAKTQTQMVNGKAVRQEETLPLPQARNVEQAIQTLEQQGSWLELPLQRINVIFSITNHRQVYNLSLEDSLYELALDDCLLSCAHRQQPLKEVELELKKGSEKEFSLFAGILQQKCGLSVPHKSKVETARTLLEE